MNKLAELIAQIRYYGTLRFAMLAVFAAVTVGLVTAFFRPEVPLALRLVLALFGGAATVIFFCLQIKLSTVHQNCIEHLKTLGGIYLLMDEKFVDILFGQKAKLPFDDILVQGRDKCLHFKIFSYVAPADNVDKILGPITLLVLALHLLCALLWVVFLLLALII